MFNRMLLAGAVFLASVGTGLTGLSVAPATAQDYFEGKTISVFAGRPPGGSIFAEAQIVAQHLGQHIPGNPQFITQSMDGAGGVVLGNYLFNNAAPDGLTIGIPGRTGFILGPIVGNEQARYQLEEFSWLGTAASSNFMLWVHRDLGINSLEDLQALSEPIVIGGSSGANADTVVPTILQEAGLPLRVIAGYPGIGEQVLALERREIDGVVTGAESFSEDVKNSGMLIPIMQTFPIAPDLPIFRDVVTDEGAQGVLGLFEITMGSGLTVVAPPNMDPEVLAILRDAYFAMVNSDDYIAAARAQGFAAGESPMSGAELEDYLRSSAAAVNPEHVEAYFRYTAN